MGGSEPAEDSSTLRLSIGDSCAFVVNGGDGFDAHHRLMRAGTWEPELVGFIERMAGPDTVFYDIGAWYGPFTLIAAAKGARVVAVEPDPVAFGALNRNVALNGFAVTTLNAAIGKDRSTTRLYAHTGFGDSMTNVLVESDSFVDVETVSFTDLPRFDDAATTVLKIDIEGMEYELAGEMLDFCRERKCTVSLALHPRNLWRFLKKSMPGLAARCEALRRTQDIIGRFRAAGYVPVDRSYGSITTVAVLKCMLRRRPKDFDILLAPGPDGADKAP